MHPAPVRRPLARPRLQPPPRLSPRRTTAMRDVRSPGYYSPAEPVHVMPAKHYLNETHGPASWFLTKDHKRIALLYLYSVSAFFLVGGIFAMLIRLELATPRGDLMSPETYNKVFTAHGVVMVFFF